MTAPLAPPETSSSAYGPEEAFKALGAHTYLAVGMTTLGSILGAQSAGARSRHPLQFGGTV